MADQLYLSYCVEGFTGTNMLRHYGKLLGKFPYSRLDPAAVLRVHAISAVEPVLFETPFKDAATGAPILDAAREFAAADSALEVEANWDLWQHTGEWKLAPSRVSLWCFGPKFEGEDENLRIDFGIDANFLPQPDSEGELLPVQSNIRSLLSLVHELDATLLVESRRLRTESGENFAEKLQRTLETAG